MQHIKVVNSDIYQC